MSSIRSGVAAFAALAVCIAVGCGSSETVTVTEESASPPPETVTERVEAPAKKKKAPASETTTPDDSGGGDTGVVPDLVGVDHQLAQDTLQAEGFYLINETDCSGQDRLLLWDRNWVVVEQEPPGGSSASLDESVTLCSVKDGE